MKSFDESDKQTPTPRAGANDDHNGFRSVITSYDYGAPMSEAGDLTAKYWAIRDVVAKVCATDNCHHWAY